MRVLLCILVIGFLAAAQKPEQKMEYDGTPLLRAKLALELARARVQEDRFADAADALRDAARALADYERDSPGPHAETSAFIREQLLDYAPRIAREHSDALDRVDLWLAPVNRWYGAIRK